jgi:hypothetical protein
MLASSKGWLGWTLFAMVASCSITQTTELASDASTAGSGGVAGGNFGGSDGGPWPDGGGGTAGFPSGGTSGSSPGGSGGVAPGGGGSGGVAGNPGGGGTGGVLGWNPSTIPGCVLWLDAADNTINAPSGEVTGWEDKCLSNDASGNGNTRPKVMLGLQNGLPGIRFDGIDDLLQVGGSSVDTASFAMFFVVKLDPAAPRAVWSNRGLVTTLNAPTFFGVNGGKGYLFQNTSVPTTLQAPSPLSNQAMLYDLSVTPLSRKIFENGSQIDTDAATGITSTSVPGGLLGSDQATQVFLAMDLFEVVVFSNALTPADEALVRAKLKEKWALP